MFDDFPKQRPELPPDVEKVYKTWYSSNRRGMTPASSASQRLESWLHVRVAADVRGDRSPKSTLEVGAGTLNQLPYEPEVGPYDIVEPFVELYESSPLLSRVRTVYRDFSMVPESARYDRITSVAAFEHIANLPEVVARAGGLLNPRGTLRVSIPSEGTLLWTLGWTLTTGLEFRLKHGLDYGKLMRHEHVNTAQEIEEVLLHFFDSVDCSVFGLTRGWSLYRYYESRGPKLSRCQDYLAGLSARV